MAQHTCTATSHDLSTAFHSLGFLRFYDAAIYKQLTGALLHTISRSIRTPGLEFNMAFFSCALSSHFDSSVDALAAAPVSQQSLKQWGGQDLCNSLYSWAILTASAAGADTANMRSLAQRLFREASRRGAASFRGLPVGLGQLITAHWEAKHKGLAGIRDRQLLKAAEEQSLKWNEDVGRSRKIINSQIAAALQGHHAVQAALVHGHHTLHVSHPSCPRGLVIALTHCERDYLRSPASQLTGKTNLRLEQVKRCVDGVVLLDEFELQQEKKQLRALLLRRLDEVVEGSDDD